MMPSSEKSPFYRRDRKVVVQVGKIVLEGTVSKKRNHVMKRGNSGNWEAVSKGTASDWARGPGDGVKVDGLRRRGVPATSGDRNGDHFCLNILNMFKIFQFEHSILS